MKCCFHRQVKCQRARLCLRSPSSSGKAEKGFHWDNYRKGYPPMVSEQNKLTLRKLSHDRKETPQYPGAVTPSHHKSYCPQQFSKLQKRHLMSPHVSRFPSLRLDSALETSSYCECSVTCRQISQDSHCLPRSLKPPTVLLQGCIPSSTEEASGLQEQKTKYTAWDQSTGNGWGS